MTTTLLSLYRSLTRHRLYAALNIGGLAVGIAVFIVLGLFVRFETGFERWLPGHERTYVMQTVWDLPESPFNGPTAFTMGGLLEQLREDFPGLLGTRMRGGERGGSVVRAGGATTEDVAQVDPEFFRVVALPMARGDGNAALARPGSAAISESVARRYFGTSDPIGQTLTVAMDSADAYRIGAVFRDLPADSEFKLGILIPLPRTPVSENWYHWGSTSLQTFLRFDTPAAARAFEGRMRDFVNRRGRELAAPGQTPWDMQQLTLQPVARTHLEPRGAWDTSRRLTVVTLGLVGVLTLLIAVVNYVNLATARAGLRAREVAMRKVLGASRAVLVRQFLGEAVVTVALAALGGLVLAELGLPFVNAAGDVTLTMPYGVVVPALALLTLVVGVVAGLYPAVLLSRFPAAAVLASARSPGGGRAGTRVREALVVLQFGLAIAFMIGTAVLVAQTRHVRQSDLGFRRDGLIVLPAFADSLASTEQRRAVMAEVARLPGVSGVTLANSAAGGSGENNSDNVPLPGVAGSGPSLRWIIVGPRFFEVHGARLVAGRLFDERRAADDTRTQDLARGINIVINRRALPTLGFASAQDAIGRTVGGGRPRTIVGVVDDLRFFSPRTPNAATYYIFYREAERASSAVLTLRTAGDPRATLAAVRDVWQRIVPDVPFNGETAETRLAEFYAADDRATRLFGIGSGLAVLIGCIGLWGLAAFNTARRTREVGIRKTLGASSADIVQLLVGQFLRPVLLANLVAWPLAFVALRTWLAGFDDPVALSPVYFVGASLVALLVAVATVLARALRASRAAPAWALRHD